MVGGGALEITDQAGGPLQVVFDQPYPQLEAMQPLVEFTFGQLLLLVQLLQRVQLFAAVAGSGHRHPERGVDLMGNAGHQVAQRRHLFALYQLSLHGAQIIQRLFKLRGTFGNPLLQLVIGAL